MNHFSNSKLYITIMAGGLSKRMNSHIPKVLHLIKNTPMIIHIIKQMIMLNPDKIIIVVPSKYHDLIKSTIENYIQIKSIQIKSIIYVEQPVSLGTAHAIKCTLPYLESGVNNIILNGDVPLLQCSTVKSIYEYYNLHKSQMLITAIDLSDPTGNGRVILNNNACPCKIIEEKDCDLGQKLITLVNCGIYIVTSDFLIKYIPLIQNNNVQTEYYLTDIVEIVSVDKKSCDLFILEQSQKNEIYNINTKEQLCAANNF